MAFNIKNTLARYDLTTSEIDWMYQKIWYKVSRQNLIGYSQEEMVEQLFLDSLEERGVPGQLANKVVSFYSKQIQGVLERNEKKLADKIMNSTEEPIKIIEKELMEDDAMQTSGEINSALGMNKKNPKYSYVELYGKKTK